jgi:glycosyltransferase involved in cell wall biosynthesis
LNQTFQNFEIIVVDDGSTDNTDEIIESIKDERIRYIKHEKNKGPSAARNTGILNSNSEFIAFLDSDDIWVENKLEKQIKAFESLDSNTAVVHCGIQYIDYKTEEPLTRWIIKEDINKKIFDNLGNAPGTPTMIIRKSALLDVGFFDERLFANEETDLGIRIAKKYKFFLVDEFLVISTRNHYQINSNPDTFLEAKEIIYEKHKAFLTKNLSYNICNMIAGNSIVKRDNKKAKKYLLIALKYKPYKIKTLLSFFLVNTLPSLNFILYKKKYQLQQNKN